MNFSQMGWAEIGVFALGFLLIAAGSIAFIVGLLRDQRDAKRILRSPDASVGRDCFRDRPGVSR